MKSFSTEIVTEEELTKLFEVKDHPVAYDGFEPSGLAGIHFGLMRARNIKKMLDIGIHFKLYLADYFAYLNNKLGGDIDHIETAGEYFVEVWKAAGVDTKRVEIVRDREMMGSFSYWDRMMKIGKEVSLDRVKRAITIMGRVEGDSVSAGQIFYPIMQATDVFELDVDICQLGIDQRKANMLAREVAKKYSWKVPVVVSHPLLLGLKGMPQGLKTKGEGELMQYKMSKSDPKNSISVHDTPSEIRSKISSAYCPEKVVEGNPMFDYLDKLILEDKSLPITIERPQKFGGNIRAGSFDELAKIYAEGKLHPMDLKNFVATGLEEKIRPIREHFEKNKVAHELYDTVKGYSVTR
ncbi:MAG: tyrosine--tRNA ligase [Candidatus Micrarchaeota archaeon]|nr:tyrosine--tRNA ligase [Candidatus Micrarchaeota archaeon]MDE1847386.1 tyrosine--tRNA ligase [Candidatus Micrarchaeota archaeon]MDE1864001.1 tyrosine--tRNA ligase [Candidatus Micrarchaeota archaeon]